VSPIKLIYLLVNNDMFRPSRNIATLIKMYLRKSNFKRRYFTFLLKLELQDCWFRSKKIQFAAKVVFDIVFRSTRDNTGDKKEFFLCNAR